MLFVWILTKFPFLRKEGTIMVTRKNTAVAFIAILIAVWLVVFVTQVEAETTDEQKQALIGEWNGAWPALPPAYCTLIIHEIDSANAKARCTYTTASRGEKKYPVMADFIPGPQPKLEFSVEGFEMKFFLKDKVLQGTGRGITPGGLYSNTIEMKKKPQK
jgi:hypothetical protein